MFIFVKVLAKLDKSNLLRTVNRLDAKDTQQFSESMERWFEQRRKLSELQKPIESEGVIITQQKQSSAVKLDWERRPFNSFSGKSESDPGPNDDSNEKYNNAAVIDNDERIFTRI